MASCEKYPSSSNQALAVKLEAMDLADYGQGLYQVRSIPPTVQEHILPAIVVGDPRFDPAFQARDHYGIFNTEEEASVFVANIPDISNARRLDTRLPHGLINVFKVSTENNIPDADYPSLQPNCSVVISCEQTGVDNPMKLVTDLRYTVWRQPWGEYFLDRQVDRYVTLTKLGQAILDETNENTVEKEIEEAVDRWIAPDQAEDQEDQSIIMTEVEEADIVLPESGGAVNRYEANQLLVTLFSLRSLRSVTSGGLI